MRPASAREEDGDISGTPGEAHRERKARHEIDRTAATEPVEEGAKGPARPMAKNEEGAGAFSARARQRVSTATHGPAGHEGSPNPVVASEDVNDQAGKRGRQMNARLVRMHGGLVIEGGR